MVTYRPVFEKGTDFGDDVVGTTAALAGAREGGLLPVVKRTVPDTAGREVDDEDVFKERLIAAFTAAPAAELGLLAAVDVDCVTDEQL